MLDKIRIWLNDGRKYLFVSMDFSKTKQKDQTIVVKDPYPSFIIEYV